MWRGWGEVRPVHTWASCCSTSILYSIKHYAGLLFDRRFLLCFSPCMYVRAHAHVPTQECALTFDVHGNRCAHLHVNLSTYSATNIYAIYIKKKQKNKKQNRSFFRPICSFGLQITKGMIF